MLLWVLLSLLHVGLSNRLFLEQAVELSRPVRFNIYNGSVAQCQFSVEQWSHQLSLGMDGSMVDGVLISDLEGVSVNATGQVTCLLANTGLSQTFSVSVRFTASRIWHALLQTYNQCPQHCLCLQTLNMSMTDPLITVSLQPFSLHIGEFLREWLSQTIHSALQNAIAAGSLDFAISLDSSRSCSQLPPREKLMFAEPPPITTLSAALGFRQARDVAVDWSYHFQTPLGVAECAGDLFKPQHLATTQSVSIQFIVGSTDVNAGEFFLASLNVNKASCPECISSCCGTFSPIFSGELTGDFGFNVFLDANMSMWANISKSSSSPSIEFRGPSECGLNDGCSINGVGISWVSCCHFFVFVSCIFL